MSNRFKLANSQKGGLANGDVNQYMAVASPISLDPFLDPVSQTQLMILRSAMMTQNTKIEPFVSWHCSQSRWRNSQKLA